MNRGVRGLSGRGGAEAPASTIAAPAVVGAVHRGFSRGRHSPLAFGLVAFTNAAIELRPQMTTAASRRTRGSRPVDPDPDGSVSTSRRARWRRPTAPAASRTGVPQGCRGR